MTNFTLLDRANLITKVLLTLILLVSLALGLSAQTIKGQLTDAQSEMPLIGATVELLSGEAGRGTTTDADGYFRLAAVPPGRLVRPHRAAVAGARCHRRERRVLVRV